jgi:uncharacterized protein (TIGR02001 family)
LEAPPIVLERSRRSSAANGAKCFLCLFIASAVFFAAPAAAQQVSGSVSVESDFRLRGYSLSAGRPVAAAKMGVDSASGLYADGSGIVVLTRDDQARFLGFQVDAGFAKRLGELWTIDVGVAHNGFRAPYSGAFSHAYTEAYVGVTHAQVAAYVFVSPDYFRRDAWTLYGQLEANVSPAKDWRLTAHVGSLNYLYTPTTYVLPHKRYYDWRVGASRELGRVELHAALSGGGPGRQYYYDELHSRTVLTVGASVSF